MGNVVDLDQLFANGVSTRSLGAAFAYASPGSSLRVRYDARFGLSELTVDEIGQVSGGTSSDPVVYAMAVAVHTMAVVAFVYAAALAVVVVLAAALGFEQAEMITD